MQALRERSTWHGRRWLSPWLLVGVIVLLAAGGAAYAASLGTRTPIACAATSCTTQGGTQGGSGSGGSGSGGSGSGGSSSRSGHGGTSAFHVSSTTPASGATGIASNTQLTVRFDAPLDEGGAMPTLSPPVAGSWQKASDNDLVFTPTAPFVPFQKYELSIPGGRGGMKSATGAHLDRAKTVTFTIADGSVLRLQQLLAQIGYLPVAYAATPTSPQDMATPQPGTFSWRWPGLPTQLTSQWVPGTVGPITKGAIMMFETENGLSVDGQAGPEVWATLLRDVLNDKSNTEPLTYVLVTKFSPEHLTAWVDGSLKFHDILVNTGVPGADTTDGTFQVFEHVRYSDMKGTDVTGTKYTDPHVPWASYFDGGEALHGYPRATYGWPQSNGCVEMRISTAGAMWPYTPIGTVVTVQGPSTNGPTPPPTTTSTTTTTTTKPAPPASSTTTSTTKPAVAPASPTPSSAG